MSHEYNYHDLPALKEFYKQNPLHTCIQNNKFSASGTYDFFVNLAYKSEDIGRCISLMINVVNLSMLEKFDESNFLLYRDKINNGELITSICNNEAFNHGSNLNGMISYIKKNDDGSYDINLNKRIITNVGAADLLFVSVPIWGEQENKFAILLFEGSEIPQMSLSDKLSGLTSCPTGSIITELKNYKNVRLVSNVRKSLFVMRHMYNMERFLLGCIMTGILKKILKYALDEKDNDVLGKFNNQYLQDKIIKIFDSFVRLESLMINCIHYMNTQTPVESILSVIKLACINDVHDAIMLLKEICGGKSYFKDHISSKFLADHEAINHLGGTRELMKQTLYQELQSKKTRSLYV